MKAKAHVPAPNKYNLQGDFILKANAITGKSPRTMPSEEIMLTAKRNGYPDQCTYKLSHTQTEKKPSGCFNFKSDRNGYLEEAALIGKESALFKDKNYSHVDPKLRTTNFYKPLPAKPTKKVSLSPTSYNTLSSFKDTQIHKPKVYISKYKNENFVNETVRKNKWKLGPGTHDHTKGE